MKTRVVVQRNNGFVYLRLLTKIFARTQNAVPDMTGKQLLKKLAANGPFIHSPGSNVVTIPATIAEVITAAGNISQKSSGLQCTAQRSTKN